MKTNQNDQEWGCLYFALTVAFSALIAVLVYVSEYHSLPFWG